MEKLVENLSETQLETYRKNGWTIRLVMHHCYESHHNSNIRFKWTLTENTPVIKAYYEDKWVALSDAIKIPIQFSLQGLSVLHAKWVYLLRLLSDDDLKRTFIHPENNEEVSLKENIDIYA